MDLPHPGRELGARLVAFSRSLETVNQRVAELMWQDAEGLNVSDLRRVGHRLVSLAGDLTTLGVDAARWADEFDESIGTDG
ncbi:MAG: hypothetical protein ACRDQ4_20335 [Pseudonocardiaceae bacterium]